jgi:Kef-type K+ transport system membrane component KefB
VITGTDTDHTSPKSGAHLARAVRASLVATASPFAARRMAWVLLALGMTVPAGLAWASAESGGGHVDIVAPVGYALIAAAILALIFNRLRQPAMLAYIAAGLMLSIASRMVAGGAMAEAAHTLEPLSHLGLVFLLFIIGLELDVKNVLKMGRGVALATFLQAPVAIAVIIGVQAGLAALGVSAPGFAHGRAGWIYFATAAALSSTAVVVKLLHDKFDLGSRAGKVSLLTLIVQDIWAVLVLSYVSSAKNADESAGQRLALLVGAVAIGVAFYLTARHVLSRVFLAMTRAPELVILTSIAWCFLGAQAMEKVGLSAEMGALVAGVTLGSQPQRLQVLAHVSSLRDFFLALFFVALGMSLPVPTVSVVLGALALTAVVVVSRVVLFAPTLMGAGMAPTAALAAAINLAQISEFSLVIAAVGQSSGALTRDETATISLALMTSVVLSSYAIRYNYDMALAIERVVRRVLPSALPAGGVQLATGRANGELAIAALDHTAPPGGDGAGGGHGSAEILVLGYFTNADSLMRLIRERDPSLLRRLLVVDFNTRNHANMRALGLNVAYGDIGQPETLRHLGIDHARIVVSTINDHFLRGTSNEALLAQVHRLNPQAKVIVTAVDAMQAKLLSEAGAWRVVCEPNQNAPAYAEALEEGLASE